MNIGFPFSIDSAGHTTTVDRDEYIRQLVELAVFTTPGERIDRPDFGAGVFDLVFEMAGSAVATAITAVADASVRQALVEIVDVVDVEASFDDIVLTITITYIDRVDAQPRTVHLEHAP